MQIDHYMARISGPLLDCIDLHIEVPAVPFRELAATAEGTSSASMRVQVDRARQTQRQRFGPDSYRLTCRMSSRQLRRLCALDAKGKGLLKNAMDELGLLARAPDRILRAARTIADLDGAADIQPGHLSEAIGMGPSCALRSATPHRWSNAKAEPPPPLLASILGTQGVGRRSGCNSLVSYRPSRLRHRTGWQGPSTHMPSRCSY
jgi:hypothetical protein